MSYEKSVWSSLANIVLLLAVGLMLFREDGIVRSRLAERKVAKETARFVEANWSDLASARGRLGASKVPVSLVMFTDYQCPFCREASAAVLAFLHGQPAKAVAVRHLPVSGHRGDRSAWAAICGAVQGRFAELSVALYEAGTSPTEPDYVAVAQRAGVEDVERFRSCYTSQEVRGDVAMDIEFARRIGLRGTPAFVTPDGTVGHLPELRALLEAMNE